MATTQSGVSGPSRVCTKVKQILIYRKVGPGRGRSVKVELIPGIFVLVDDCDADIPFRLILHHGYSGFRDGSRHVYLHNWVASRMGMVLQPGEEVDHINRDRLDCQRHNLRPASRSLQMSNQDLRKDSTTGIQGVSKRGTKYGVWVNGKYLGRFNTPEEASRVREEAKRARDAKLIRDCPTRKLGHK